MILAELEVFHSRVYSPTRRLSIGRRHLPVDPPPGFGPLLLGAVIAVGADALDEDDHDELLVLMDHLERGRRVVQPRLRHRFQVDHQGLGRTHCVLLGDGESLDLDFDGHGNPLQMTLAATYAAGQLPLGIRPRVYDVLRKGLLWRGEIGDSLFRHLSGPGGPRSWGQLAYGNPTRWALDLFGLAGGVDDDPDRRVVQRRFRELVREAHPDHGAAVDGAAARIAELTEARRILIG